MFRSFDTVKSAVPSLALFAAAAGVALPSAEASAAFVDNTSWTINVSADPIGCPGTATVTASFRFKKAAFGGPLGGGTLNARLYDADGDGLFGSADDLIGTATVTWGAQTVNFVDLTVTFTVECVQTDGGWCTIRGNAGTDDEGDPHEMYIYIEQPNSGTFWNNSWTSPKNQGNWIKYSFPLRCGCDAGAGEAAEYDIAWHQSGQSSTVVTFDLPGPSPTQPPLEYFQALFHTDLDQLDLLDVVPLGDGGRADDIFGQPSVQPVPEGFFVSMPVIDPQAAQQLDNVGFEILMQQIDPFGYGLVRIAHDETQTFGQFADGSLVQFDPTDGEIPVRPLENQPPLVDIELIELNLQGIDPIIVGFPGAVQDDFRVPLPGQIDLDLRVLDPNGQILFEAEKPAAVDGGFDFPLPPLPPLQIGGIVLGATDLSGNRVEVPLPFSVPCNEADFSPPFGVLDLFDLNAFITAFVGGSLDADLNNDGIVDLLDIGRFINAFTAGCP